MRGVLQERLEELGSAILELINDKVHVIGFMSEERLLDYKNGLQCFSSEGIYDICDIDYSRIMDNALVITMRDGKEISRYQFEPIFVIKSVDNFKYLYIEQGKKKWTTKAFKIRKCKCTGLYNFYDGINSILFESFDALNNYFLEVFNKKVEDIYSIRYFEETDQYLYKDFDIKSILCSQSELQNIYLNRLGKKLNIENHCKWSSEDVIDKVLAIDVETANGKRTSICSVGIALLEHGKIIMNKEYLINPKEDFNFINMSIHKITPDMVEDKPIFSEVWKEIESLIDDNTLVISHNNSFDMDALYKVSEKYKIKLKTFSTMCTLIAAQNYWENLESYKLNILAEKLDRGFNHHIASDDALICLEIFKELTRDMELITREGLEKNFDIILGKISKKGYKRCLNKRGTINRKKKNRGSNREKIKVKDFKPENPVRDVSHPIYGKMFAFTGEYKYFKDRDEAKQKVVNLGGCLNNDSVTKKTDYLVVGTTNLIETKGKKKSSKLRKAEEYKAKGQDIKIINEEEFIELLS